MNERRYPVGLKKKPMNALLWPSPREPSASAAVVRYDRVASPVTRLQMLTPSFDSRPSPFDTLRTISAAFAGLLETMSR